jgi:hypothetical protein
LDIEATTGEAIVRLDALDAEIDAAEEAKSEK